jgi:hypothetical protein
MSGLSAVRRNAATQVIALAALLLVVVGGCSDGTDGDNASATTSTSSLAEPPLRTAFSLPFGLEQVDGMIPIGRPAVRSESRLEFAGEPVTGVSLDGAYWVTGDDPVGVFRRFVAQMDRLPIGRIDVVPRQEGSADGWMSATASRAYDGRAGIAWATVTLWSAAPDPILLVSAHVGGDTPLAEVVVTDDGAEPESPSSLGTADRGAGDVLFEVQSIVVHLPPGSRALTPALPFEGGVSVLSADDGLEAVTALIAEATSLSSGGVTGPSTISYEGVDVTSGSFVQGAGGWEMRTVAVRAPGDAYATVYVWSGHD